MYGSFISLLDRFFVSRTGFLFGTILFAGIIAKDTKCYIDPLRRQSVF